MSYCYWVSQHTLRSYALGYYLGMSGKQNSRRTRSFHGGERRGRLNNYINRIPIYLT